MGNASLTTDDGLEREVSLTACAFESGSSIEVEGSDSAGNALQVKAESGTGGWTFDGGDQTRQGSIDDLDVDVDGAFTATGRAAPIGGASTPAQVEIEGTCRV